MTDWRSFFDPETHRRDKTARATAATKKWRESHRDYFKTAKHRSYKRKYAQRWRAAHPDQKRTWTPERQQRNTLRMRELRARWRSENPQKIRDLALRWKYGLTVEDFSALLALQDGRCAICSIALDGTSGRAQPNVDHDHVDGRVRGILCPSCNLVLGLAKDDTAILEAAVLYLQRGTK